MRYECGFTRRFQRTHEAKLPSPWCGEMLDGRALQILEIRIGLERAHDARLGTHCAPRGRPPGPKCVTACTASRSAAGATPGNTEIATEQQISAECMPGWIASDTAIRRRGSFRRTRRTRIGHHRAGADDRRAQEDLHRRQHPGDIIFASSGVSAAMLTWSGALPSADNGNVGGGWKPRAISIACSGVCALASAALAVASARANHLP